MTKELKTKAVKIVEKLLASQKERADFLNDTEAYLKSAKVDLDENVVSEIKLALEELDKKFLEVGINNPFRKNMSDDEKKDEDKSTTMNALAVAAVSAAAVAVAASVAVAAVTAVTSMVDRDI